MINKELILNVEQGSDEWLNARIGVVTASNFSKITTPTGAKSSSKNAYMAQMLSEIVEREAGVDLDTYCSADMARGNELEPSARYLFQNIKQIEVEQIGLVYKDENEKIACSPDGVMRITSCDCDENFDFIQSGLEIKCPKLQNHINYVLSGVLPKQYIAQVQGSMWVCDVSEWWFMSYHPLFKPLIINVQRDDAFIEKLAENIDDFLLVFEKHKKDLRKNRLQ